MELIRTLVVDDEPGMRMSVKRTLSKFTITVPDIEDEFGFEIDVAETAEEALEKIETQHPGLLLLDYKLPGMSGLDLLSKVTPKPHEMLTIMITAYASIETAVVAVQSGAFDFLAKPFTPDELKKTVTKAARRLILARQVRKLAQEKHKVRFQFVSVLGHELKAPLNSVDGYLDILKKKVLGNDLSAYETMVDRCLVRIQGMRKIINDLLDLTQIESGERERELKEYDLRETVKLALETALPEAEEKKISVNFKADVPVLLLADPGEIEIIMNNLISNAIKYNKEGGTVEIHLAKTDDTIRIEVTDTGIGMTEDEAGRLFNEFVRIKNEKTRKILGSGLGLTILKKIARLYAGEVTVKSQPDVGSTFTVVLHDPKPREE
jgi:signal transduction histidine kinase